MKKKTLKPIDILIYPLRVLYGLLNGVWFVLLAVLGCILFPLSPIIDFFAYICSGKYSPFDRFNKVMEYLFNLTEKIDPDRLL